MTDQQIVRTDIENAAKFANWIANRGGIAVWRSRDLSDPAFVLYTPLKAADGTKYGKPHWKVGEKPDEVITDPARIEVVTYREFKRFHVAVRRGAQGLSLKVSDGGTRRINSTLAKAEREGYENPVYQFDYSTQEAVILVPDSVQPLASVVPPTL